MVLINIINKNLFVTFDSIVHTGRVVLFDSSNRLIAEHKFLNSVFEKIKLPDYSGNASIRVEYDNSEYQKKININSNKNS